MELRLTAPLASLQCPWLSAPGSAGLLGQGFMNCDAIVTQPEHLNDTVDIRISAMLQFEFPGRKELLHGHKRVQLTRRRNGSSKSWVTFTCARAGHSHLPWLSREVVFLEAKDIFQPDSSRLLKEIFRMLQIAESNQAEMNVCEIARLLV